MKVLLLGYGEMGHAFEFMLSRHHEVRIWSLELPGCLEDLSKDIEVIIFCLPVNAHEEVLQQLLPYMQLGTLCLTIAKGLNESGLTAQQIFESGLKGKYPFGVIYGPMISEEIRRDRYSFADVAMSKHENFEIATRLLSGSKLIFRHSTDMTGISWSVILKNVYAILFGIADGLQLGDNMRGHLMVQAIAELSSIVRQMGGDAASCISYAGLGDLVTTATSIDSHHHALGVKISRGEYTTLQGEGVHTLQMIERYRLFSSEDYPLFSLVADIMHKPENAAALLNGYMQNLLSKV